MSRIASNKNSQSLTPDTYNGTHAAEDTEFVGVPEPMEGPRFVAPTHGGVDILKLLTHLESLVDNTRRGPFRTLIGFDEETFHMTIMKIRANLPEEMKRASKLARDSERIVEETQAQAERIMEDARNQAVRIRTEAQNELERVRSQHEQHGQEILTQARREAAEIIAEAREQAGQMVSDSDIVQTAQVEAQELLNHARREADEAMHQAQQEADCVRQGADDYARDLLTNLDSVLGRALQQVQRGREMLERP